VRIGIPADAVSLSERAADRNTLTREESRKPHHRRPSQRVGAWMSGDGRLHGRRYMSPFSRAWMAAPAREDTPTYVDVCDVSLDSLGGDPKCVRCGRVRLLAGHQTVYFDLALAQRDACGAPDPVATLPDGRGDSS